MAWGFFLRPEILSNAESSEEASSLRVGLRSPSRVACFNVLGPALGFGTPTMASPALSAASQTGESSGSKKEDRIDNLLQWLGIDEEEIDDLVFEEEADAPKEGIKWMALVKVHYMNFFSPQTFEQHMRVAWSPARDVKFRALENNLFTIQCFCLGD